jgi:hypothetical protein
MGLAFEKLHDACKHDLQFYQHYKKVIFKKVTCFQMLSEFEESDMSEK